MKLEFHKYQGTGNDFVMVDDRADLFPKNDTTLISFLCNRRFGIGADGLILLSDIDGYDFKMTYFNADGRESSMCGNGGRCIVAFAHKLGIIGSETNFLATDGPHFATIYNEGFVSLQMKDVLSVKVTPEYVFLDTGSPHHVEMISQLSGTDVKGRGASIRYSDLYGPGGSNVNFVEQTGKDRFAMRTYERGVEDETLSCGTGATATAIAMRALGKTRENTIRLEVQGGELEVTFTELGGLYTDVFLKGPATFVYKGTIEIPTSVS